jgi:hypothetical protein
LGEQYVIEHTGCIKKKTSDMSIGIVYESESTLESKAHKRKDFVDSPLDIELRTPDN